ncbi:hypothetical protein [Streptosporangium saharense]|uniref:Uncharacterized protein n=1 Tax=Streptosporangium saharense TaxID=1706840 RepID=A0A7W7QG97_9ACTN|nr:hypothetical protein [Streptosporangium saharense]MBB4912984.1 hypothetical protein [Streptosporangium saharense]
MLPLRGVTQQEPFTHPQLPQPPLRATLHRLVRRAYSRVRQDDLGALRVALSNTGVDNYVRSAAVPDYTNTAVNDALEKLITVFVDKTPYVAQAGNRQNQPPGNAGQAVLKTMVDEATTAFTQIAAGNADAHITAVFNLADGARLPEIKRTFTEAAKGLRRLHDNRLILLDHRGDLDIQGAGAVSSPRSLTVPVTFADARTDARVRILLHESFHIASKDIVDHIYFGAAGFSTVGWPAMKTNADHYAEVARRHAGLTLPAPAPLAVLAPAAGPALTPAQELKVSQALTEAQERLTKGWARSLWVWQNMGLVQRYQNSYLWLGEAPTTELLVRQLMLESQQISMTLHHGTGGRATTPPDVPPVLPLVTAYDLAVMEEVLADLHRLVSWGQAQQTVHVLAAGTPLPAGNAAYLWAADVTNAATSVGNLADQFVTQATQSLASPWLPNAPALKTLVDGMRVRYDQLSS